MTQYRIRWALVSHYNGTFERRCLAEKQVGFLWFNFYWPLSNGNWRIREEDALRDIEADKMLNSPLPSPKIIK